MENAVNGYMALLDRMAYAGINEVNSVNCNRRYGEEKPCAFGDVVLK
jgi:hypothetical protein